MLSMCRGVGAEEEALSPALLTQKQESLVQSSFLVYTFRSFCICILHSVIGFSIFYALSAIVRTHSCLVLACAFLCEGIVYMQSFVWKGYSPWWPQ